MKTDAASPILSIRLAMLLVIGICITGQVGCSSGPDGQSGRVASANLEEVGKHYGRAKALNAELKSLVAAKTAKLHERTAAVSQSIRATTARARSGPSDAARAELEVIEAQVSEGRAASDRDGELIREREDKAIAEVLPPLYACVAAVAREQGYALVLDSSKSWDLSSKAKGGQGGVLFQVRPRHLPDAEIVRQLGGSEDITAKVIASLPR